MAKCDLCREADAEHSFQTQHRGVVVMCTHCIKQVVKYYIERIFGL